MNHEDTSIGSLTLTVVIEMNDVKFLGQKRPWLPQPDENFCISISNNPNNTYAIGPYFCV
jgi:hypothetical protein